MVKSEYVSEVDKEVGVVGAIGVSEADVDRSKEGEIAVSCLYAVEVGQECVEVGWLELGDCCEA